MLKNQKKVKNRIQIFLKEEGLSSAKFADEIGVQRSGVSHILSGRNKPSLDFLEKMLSRYRALNAEWLVSGKGEMFKPSVIEYPSSENHAPKIRFPENLLTPKPEKIIEPIHPVKEEIELSSGKEVDRIIIIYTDRSFEVLKNSDS